MLLLRAASDFTGFPDEINQLIAQDIFSIKVFLSFVSSLLDAFVHSPRRSARFWSTAERTTPWPFQPSVHSKTAASTVRRFFFISCFYHFSFS
jgi:hypothetical protein